MQASDRLRPGAPDVAAPERKTRVFLSYSRRDTGFVETLAAALAGENVEPLVDRHDILPGEAWKERLKGLVVACDAVAVIVTPDWAGSSVCGWELDEAERLGKRLLPVIHRDTTLGPQTERLASLNYIYARPGNPIAACAKELAVAARTDIGWTREHTRLGELAERWEAAGRPAAGGRLVRGDELAASESWLASRPSTAPIVTEATRAFIAASRLLETFELAQAKRTRRRSILSLSAAAALALGLTGLAIAANLPKLRESLHWYNSVRAYVLSPETEARLKPGDTFFECARGDEAFPLACPTMVVLPRGTFLMGSPDSEGDKSEHPQRSVSIGYALAVGKFEITFDQWQVCVDSGGCSDVSDNGFGRADRPVINADRVAAQRYADWLGQLTGKPYRLLSEAEWEYAARAGTATRYSWGDDPASAGRYAWYKDNSGKATQPVGRKTANAFGLNDMHGNVWEWVADNNHKAPTDDGGPPADGSVWRGGETSMGLLRGGSWDDKPDDLLRSARRLKYRPDFDRNIGIGFRVARRLMQ